MNEIIFDLEKIKLGIFINPKIIKIESYDSFITNQFVLELKAFIAIQQKQEKTIDFNFEVNIEPPKFTDWLFRKSKTKIVNKQVKVSSKDVLLNPPQIIPGQTTIRFFNFDKMDKYETSIR